MNQLGYIMLFRKIKDWRWYKDGNTFRLFLHLLLEASRKQFDFELHKLLPGQLITGRKALAMDLGLSEQEIRTSINKLKSTSEITIKSTNRFSIVTICNWRIYQSIDQSDQPTKQPIDQQSINHQPTTYKKLRSKEDKNTDSIPPPFSEIEEYFANTIANKGKNLDAKIEAEKFDAHYGSIGWKVGKTKMTDWKKSASGWILRATEAKGQSIQPNGKTILTESQPYKQLTR